MLLACHIEIIATPPPTPQPPLRRLRLMMMPAEPFSPPAPLMMPITLFTPCLYFTVEPLLSASLLL